MADDIMELGETVKKPHVHKMMMTDALKCIYDLNELDAYEKITLIIIGMSDRSACVISIDELAKNAGFCTRTASRVVNKLIASGYLIKKNRFDNEGAQLSNSYQLSSKCFNLGAKNG